MRRLMNLQVVVFPEPDTPTRATKLPLHMERERSFTAKLRPPSNDFVTRPSSISAVRCGPHKMEAEEGPGPLAQNYGFSAASGWLNERHDTTRISANASVGRAVT